MTNGKITIKSPEEIKIMAKGGSKLGRVKNALAKAIRVGVKASDIERLAMDLIKKEGAEASFAKVPGYRWATCVNVNEGLVHGIPSPDIVFKDGDIISVDVGIYYKGFHTDTSISIGLNPSPENQKFLNVGQETLNKAIKVAKAGNCIYDISKAIENSIKRAGYTPIRALVGHGVGRELHEDPQIPCFLPGRVSDSPKIEAGMVFAIEVMCTQGGDAVEIDQDGWTIKMADGKISGLFEDTVAVTDKGPRVLTH